MKNNNKNLSTYQIIKLAVLLGVSTLSVIAFLQMSNAKNTQKPNNQNYSATETHHVSNYNCNDSYTM